MAANSAQSGGTSVSDSSTRLYYNTRQVNITLPVVMKVSSSPVIFRLCVLLARRSKPIFVLSVCMKYDVFDVPTKLLSSASSLRAVWSAMRTVEFCRDDQHLAYSDSLAIVR